MIRAHLSRSRRAVGFIWFLIVALPILFFGAALAVDTSNTIVANRQVRLAAESAAVGAAWQIKADAATHTISIDAIAANTVANQTFTQAVSAGSLKKVSVISTVVSINTKSNPQTVTVRVTYRVNEDIFYSLLGTAPPNYSTHASAFLCRPDQATSGVGGGSLSGTTGGHCVRPGT